MYIRSLSIKIVHVYLFPGVITCSPGSYACLGITLCPPVGMHHSLKKTGIKNLDKNITDWN